MKDKAETEQTDVAPYDWIISDTHFYHNNIVKYCYRPGWNKYGNHDYTWHNNLMESNWVNRVGENDSILHLGDVAFSVKKKRDAIAALFASLPGDKYLIKGNHDNAPNEWYEEIGFTVLDPFFTMHNGYKVYFTHYPMVKLYPEQINIHGHVHNNSVDCMTKAHKNISADVMAFAPVPMQDIMDDCVYRVNESNERDVAPNDHKYRKGTH